MGNKKYSYVFGKKNPLFKGDNYKSQLGVAKPKEELEGRWKKKKTTISIKF